MSLDKPLIVKTVNRLLLNAIEEGVNFIHCEFINGDGLNIAWLKEGRLNEIACFTEPLSEDIKNYLHALFHWTSQRFLSPTTITLTTDSGKINLHAQGLATKNGEKIIINLKSTDGAVIPLASLGLNNEHLSLLKTAITSNGLVVITGPHNSGKTTTAYAILTALNANRANIYTIENVIGKKLLGINQLSRPRGLSWSMLFRTLEKQDADIIYLDATDDCLPSSSELSSIINRRLLILNLEATSIDNCLAKLNLGQGTAKINLIINQRLVRRLCPHCVFNYQLDQTIFNELIKDFGSLDQELIGLNLYHNGGCNLCQHSGYSGYLGLFEMLLPSTDLKQLLINGGVSAQAQALINEEVTLSLLEDGFVKALQGLVTVEELKKII